MTTHLARAGGHVLVCAALVAAFAAAPAAAEKPAPDIAVELTTEPFGAGLGEPVEHRIAIRNRGSATAADVAVSFTTSLPVLAPDLEDGGGDCALTDGTVLSCHWSKLRPTTGSPLTVVLRGRLGASPPLGGLVRNAAMVGTAAPDTELDDDTSANAYLLPPEPVAEAASAAPAPVEAAASPKPPRTPPYTFFALLLALALAVLTVGFLARRRDPFAELREPAESVAGRVKARFARLGAAAVERASR